MCKGLDLREGMVFLGGVSGCVWRCLVLGRGIGFWETRLDKFIRFVSLRV